MQVRAAVTALSTADGSRTAEIDEQPLRDDLRIGPYRVLRQLGRGGMGRVFLAQRDDDTFDRQVAIKVIDRDLDGPEIHRRFLAERQILTHLNHPGIAQLYEGGTVDQDRPYFVMEPVFGLPIDTYCDERQLSLDERLDLFQQVCSAVHYAHQNLVVHRDLKPSNILVSEAGVPKLLDFGIAKVLGPGTAAQGADATRTLVRVMTPNYASRNRSAASPSPPPAMSTLSVSCSISCSPASCRSSATMRRRMRPDGSGASISRPSLAACSACARTTSTTSSSRPCAWKRSDAPLRRTSWPRICGVSGPDDRSPRATTPMATGHENSFVVTPSR